MGFLWFGNKAVKSLKDFKVRDLEKEKVALNVRWDIAQADRANASRLYDQFKDLGVNADSKDKVDRAAYEMGRQAKAIRAAEEVINTTQTRMGIVDAILDTKAMEKQQASSAMYEKLNNMDSEQLESVFTRIAEERMTSILNLEKVNSIVTAHSQPFALETHRDADTSEALKEINKARGE